MLARIADAACPIREPLVIEIGPGRGALTEPLLERADRVMAIEVDPVLVLYLRQKFQTQIESGSLTLIEGDILKADLGAWGPAVIAGNLPYYITSPILDRVFAASAPWIRAVFLVQLEVANRLAAQPGSRDYGYLTVSTQARATVEKLLDVPAAAFRPPPKVDSAVVSLVPASFPGDDLTGFLDFSSLCFRHKRKKLRNNLDPAYPRERLTFSEANLRAEQISLAGLLRIWNHLRR